MKIESALRVVAGTLVLISLGLAVAFNPLWLLLAAFVSVSLIQSAFTGFCPGEIVLKKLGIGKKDGGCCK